MENIKLSAHFDLFELTESYSFPGMVHANREAGRLKMPTLIALAVLGEKVREIIGVPMLVHSGFRYPPLNKAVGSTDRSQHLRGEAMDFSPVGADLNGSFWKLASAVWGGNLQVGQLIHEKQGRGYMAKEWIHFSLGAPWRPKERSNQILSMVDGVYVLVNKEERVA